MANDCAVDNCKAVEPTGYMSEQWPRCRVCATGVCADHIAPGSEQDHDERGIDVICQPCQRLTEGLASGLNLNTQWNLWHVCESVLAPTNENLQRGDLLACLKDICQEVLLLRDTHTEAGEIR
jgi:hypothetical protein